MSLATFISKQARKPSGWFGRTVMPVIFDRGNAFLNGFAHEMMAVRPDDRVLEIGCGTGKLIYDIVPKIDDGIIEGVDFSSSMAAIARKRNKNSIANGKVRIFKGDFDDMLCDREQYSKVCSVNTHYFWPSPIKTAGKIAEVLKPDGKLILAFEDSEQIKRRKMDTDVFHLHAKEEVLDLIVNAGFSGDTKLISRKKGNLIFHCIIAKKNGG